MIRRRGLLNLLLLALVTWMGLQAYPLMIKGYGALRASPKSPQATSMVPVPSSLRVMENQKAYEDVMEKNLFRPERTRWRPPAPPPRVQKPKPPAPAPPPKPPPPVTLQGIILTGNKKVALLNIVEKGASKKITVRAAVGDEVGGVRVDAIEADRVVLQWNERPIVLYVQFQNGKKSTIEEGPEKIPRLLTDEELEKIQANKKDKPDQKMDKAKERSKASSSPAASKRRGEGHKRTSRPSHSVEKKSAKESGSLQADQEQDVQPRPRTSPRRRSPFSNFPSRRQ